MAVTKKSALKKGTKPPATEGRKKSLLTQAGDRAKWETERALLLKTLKAKAWNLTHAAAELAMGSPRTWSRVRSARRSGTCGAR